LERELEKALEEAKNVQLSKRLAAEDIDAG
jgi:hypothetical protein